MVQEENIAKRRIELTKEAKTKVSKLIITTFIPFSSLLTAQPFSLVSPTHQFRYREDEEDEEDEAVGNIEDEIEATLEEEFPLEEDDEDRENEETEEAASDRLEMEISERYVTDENSLTTVMVQRHKTQWQTTGQTCVGLFGSLTHVISAII